MLYYCLFCSDGALAVLLIVLSMHARVCALYKKNHPMSSNSHDNNNVSIYHFTTIKLLTGTGIVLPAQLIDTNEICLVCRLSSLHKDISLY